tara:strand:+ start:31 stop:246 length:216 start_codon:yes stop_codon:yes gene_type:complete
MKIILIVGGITFFGGLIIFLYLMVILMDGAMLYVYYMNYGSSLNVENSQLEREDKVIKFNVEHENLKKASE